MMVKLTLVDRRARQAEGPVKDRRRWEADILPGEVSLEKQCAQRETLYRVNHAREQMVHLEVETRESIAAKETISEQSLALS